MAIYKTPFLETERLILKRGSEEDYQKVYEYDFTKLRNIGGEFVFVKLDPNELEGFASYADRVEGVFDWIIYLKDGTPIANIVADREQKELASIELSINMHPNYWRQGYMTEALLSVLSFLFEYGFSNIIMRYDEGNFKSKNLQEKLGFELYRVNTNAWEKNGQMITTYEMILPKEKYQIGKSTSKKNK